MSDHSDFKQPNKEYLQNVHNWQLIRDLIKGESALKRHDFRHVRSSNITSATNTNNLKLNHQYLPQPDANNCEVENVVRYAQYIERASLFNVVKRTEQGMSGMVFSKPSTIDLPPSIEYLLSDADGSEVGIEQQSHEVLNDVLETARDGLFVDFPERPTATTLKEQEDLAVRANIIVYKAEKILDWRMKKVNAAMKLSFVKLAEVHTEIDPDNVFKTIEVEVIKVLILNSKGVYEQRTYTDQDTFTSIIPTDKNGKAFNYIPFFFIGAVNNRPNIDPIPLIEIAEVNLAHYRNSADFEESSFLVGQPTLVVTGLTAAWQKEFFPKGIPFGSRAGLGLPTGSAASLVQAASNSMPENGMTRKEKQMIELGARLISQGGGAETAEAARIRHGADASVLTIIVGNISQAYQDAINAVLQFQSGTEEEFKFSLNEDFFGGKLTAQDLTALVASWQQGAISKDVLDANLVNGGIISDDVDLVEMNEEIDQTPSTINF